MCSPRPALDDTAWRKRSFDEGNLRPVTVRPHQLALFASVSANAVLLAVLMISKAQTKSIPRSVADTGGLVPAPPSAQATTGTQMTAAGHDALAAGDLSGLVEKLRGAGLMPSEVRAVVQARLSAQYAPRRAALVAQQREVPYWKKGFLDDQKIAAGLRALAHDQAEMLRRVLGPEPLAPLEEAALKHRYGNVPSEKLEPLRRIVADYTDLRAQIHADANGTLLAVDRERLALLAQEERADLAKLLSPRELEEYDLRVSPTAARLRTQLAFFGASEAEFRMIFSLNREIEAQVSAGRLDRRAAEYRLTAQIKAALGSTRFAEYEAATDPKFLALGRLVERHALPLSTASDLLALQRDVMRQAAMLMEESSLTPTERNRKFTTLYQQASGKITTTLGEKGFQDYKAAHGQWLESIRPRPPGGIASKK
jgi:hypothetical protein